jgi:hypothetical protein
VTVKAVQSWVPEFDIHDSHAFRVFCAANAIPPRPTLAADGAPASSHEPARVAAWCRAIPSVFKLSSITSLTSTGLLAMPGAGRLATLPSGSQLPTSSTPAAVPPVRTNERGERLPDKMQRTSRSAPTNGTTSATSHTTNGSTSSAFDGAIVASRSVPKGPTKTGPTTHLEQSTHRATQDTAAAAYPHGGGFMQMPYYDEASMYAAQMMPGGFVGYPQYAMTEHYGAPEHYAAMTMSGYAHGMVQAAPAPAGRGGAGNYYNPDRMTRGMPETGRGDGYGTAPASKRPRTDGHFEPTAAYAAGVQAQALPAYVASQLSSHDRVMYGDTQ